MASICKAQVANDPIGPLDPGFDAVPCKLDGMWFREFGGTIGIKHFYAGKFNLTYANRETGVISYHMIGIFKQTENEIVQRSKFVTQNWGQYFNKPMRYGIGFEGDDIYAQVDATPSKEVWIRKSTQDDAKPLDGVSDFSNKMTSLEGVWFFEGSNKDGPYRVLKVYDHGRITQTYFNLKSKQVFKHGIGIYSYDGNVLRQKFQFITNNWKALRGVTVLAKVENLELRANTLTFTDGTRERWERVGERPKDDNR